MTKRIFWKNNNTTKSLRESLIKWKSIRKNLTMKESAYSREKEISRIEIEGLQPTTRKSWTETMLSIAHLPNRNKIPIRNGIMLGLITLTNSTNKFTSSIKTNSEEMLTGPRKRDKRCWIRLLPRIRNSRLKEKTITIKNESTNKLS